MTWRNHRFVTAAIAYVLDLPVEGIIVSVIASTFPDKLEFIFPVKLKHRGISHFWAMYLGLFLMAHFNFLKLNPSLSLLIEWFMLGCLFHILEDALSKSGVIFFPGTLKKIKLGELYATRSFSENLVAFVIVGICLGIKAWLVHKGLAVWKPRVVMLKDLS